MKDFIEFYEETCVGDTEIPVQERAIKVGIFLLLVHNTRDAMLIGAWLAKNDQQVFEKLTED